METEWLKSLWASAFGDSAAFIECFFSTAYAPERCLYLTEGDRITAALYWLDTEFDGRKYAYIYGVATHPDHRGKGLCRRLMVMTHERLAQQGYAGALLMPADRSLRQMYAKMGYRECSTVSQPEYRAGERGVEVHTVTVDEYADLRRKFLPKGGVIQEGENLAYLTTYAGLYAGRDFLMAAVHGEKQLFAPELLGNKERAPEILKAMGYETGIFRVPGEEIPFAMYYGIQAGAPMPTYLGLAFD